MSRLARINRLTGGDYRQVEDAVIELFTDGVFRLRSWGRDYEWSEVGATWIDADNQPGENATIAFVEGNPLLPVFFSRGSKPGSRIVSEDPITLATWFAFRASFAQNNRLEDSLQLSDSGVVEEANSSPFMVREGSSMVVSSGGSITTPFTYSHGELTEMIVSNFIFLFFASSFTAINMLGLATFVDVMYGESTVEEISEFDYNDYGHPGRECDPDGGIIIGGL